MFDYDEIIPISEDVFRLIRDIIKDYCGLCFDDSFKNHIEKRLTRRVKSHNLSDFRDYYRFIRYDKHADKELSAIMDLLTVNETYFFREGNQLKAFRDEVLEELKEINKNNRILRIWSAGCSTGEETYTIAMIINEKNNFSGWDIEIYGSDINQRVLQIARKGIYSKNSFRVTEPYFINKYFTEDDKYYKINDNLKKYVNFSCLNLLDHGKTKILGKMDVVFCRNVFIYFDKISRKKVVENFYDRLVGGGYLMLGASESLLNISTAFTLKHLKNDMVYQKPS